MSAEPLPRLTLVTGGVRAGKSHFALELLGGVRHPAFLATLDCDDDEMQERVAAHRRERPSRWQTVEAHRDLVRHLSEIATEVDAVLIDCLTNYVANGLIDGREEQAVADDIAKILEICARAPYRVVMVSNEVGFDIAPDSELGSRFPRFMGAANRRAAAQADRVYLMTAGIPVRLK